MVLASQQIEYSSSITIQAYTKSEMEEVRVNMADMKVESRRVELLTSVGSCIAICLHDPVRKCGGLAHIMLPTSTNPQEPLPSKYANTAVPALVKGIESLGGKKNFLSAKIVGGANMFSNIKNDQLNIGGKNIKAVRAALSSQKIKLVGEDVGGLHGRRVSFNVLSGLATISNFAGDTKKL